jgi:hypothetical protein
MAERGKMSDKTIEVWDHFEGPWGIQESCDILSNLVDIQSARL